MVTTDSVVAGSGFVISDIPNAKDYARRTEDERPLRDSHEAIQLTYPVLKTNHRAQTKHTRLNATCATNVHARCSPLSVEAKILIRAYRDISRSDRSVSVIHSDG